MQEEENKTVDIDTSGPDTEVELDNSTNEVETPEIETTEQTATESTETSSTETVEAASEEKKEEKKEDKDKELEQYSEGVQRRIAKLTKKWREAERQREEALTYAQRVMADKKKADEKLSKLEPGFMKSTEDSINSGIEAAKAELMKAREAGDINAEVAAQTKISELGYRHAKFLETKAQQEEIAKARETEVKQPEINLNRQEAAQGTPDPKAESWAAKNTWFGQDTAMTYTAFDLHKKLTEQEGFDPSSDEYYEEIDKRIRLEFPHKFAKKEVTETAKPVQTVASAKRSTKSGRKTVRLTPSQVAIAKKLGVPLEEYAKQLNITKEV
jgi:GH15 family glucan-1,4-alpha-glucosidase